MQSSHQQSSNIKHTIKYIAGNYFRIFNILRTLNSLFAAHLNRGGGWHHGFIIWVIVGISEFISFLPLHIRSSMEAQASSLNINTTMWHDERADVCRYWREYCKMDAILLFGHTRSEYRKKIVWFMLILVKGFKASANKRLVSAPRQLLSRTATIACLLVISTVWEQST